MRVQLLPSPAMPALPGSYPLQLGRLEQCEEVSCSRKPTTGVASITFPNYTAGRKEGKAVWLRETILLYRYYWGPGIFYEMERGSSIKHGTEKIKHGREIFNKINKVNVAVL